MQDAPNRNAPWEAVAFFVPYLVATCYFLGLIWFLWLLAALVGGSGEILPWAVGLTLLQFPLAIYYGFGRWWAQLLLITEMVVAIWFTLGPHPFPWPIWVPITFGLALVCLLLPRPMRGLINLRKRWGDEPQPRTLQE